MIKETAQANCKNEVAEEGVIDAGKQQRTGVLVGESEQEPTGHAKSYG